MSDRAEKDFLEDLVSRLPMPQYKNKRRPDPNQGSRVQCGGLRLTPQLHAALKAKSKELLVSQAFIIERCLLAYLGLENASEFQMKMHRKPRKQSPPKPAMGE